MKIMSSILMIFLSIIFFNNTLSTEKSYNEVTIVNTTYRKLIIKCISPDGQICDTEIKPNLVFETTFKLKYIPILGIKYHVAIEGFEPFIICQFKNEFRFDGRSENLNGKALILKIEKGPLVTISIE